ncbi:hypothetical protein IEO21_05414 [Rhodonia placenta]|uniref:Candidate secreted effector protein n=1 Tax=Rhodonia placenta TaxID=104341 RepID=A0A8H7P286_9APHY|nr:hypothetical protein IEO21_05414 [Postia placenta]
MRTFQLFVAFLTLFATTALADFYARGDDEGLSARDAWDDDVLFARHFDDELYARDFEEHKNHPLVRELVNILAARAGSCKNGGVKLTSAVGSCDPDNSKGMRSGHNCKNAGGKYYYCVGSSGGQCMKVKSATGLENGECFL